jgi:hypothetical protein
VNGRVASAKSVEIHPTRTLRKNFFCDAECYFFCNGLALRKW